MDYHLTNYLRTCGSKLVRTSFARLHLHAFLRMREKPDQELPNWDGSRPEIRPQKEGDGDETRCDSGAPELVSSRTRKTSLLRKESPASSRR